MESTHDGRGSCLTIPEGEVFIIFRLIAFLFSANYNKETKNVYLTEERRNYGLDRRDETEIKKEK